MAFDVYAAVIVFSSVIVGALAGFALLVSSHKITEWKLS